MTQSAEILNFLNTGKSITALGALHRFGCMRLAARIYDLRAKGHPIIEKTIKTDNGKNIASYKMEKQK